ncbi:MAG: hypothetical protein NT166_32465 [Candidatus Aminicenantes bacterium]|nr:hypothetical protein [Candidatus Aminicenantes bacterium]
MDAKTMQRSICDDKPVLRMPCDRVTANRFNIAHFWFQNLSYHNPALKSIHKKQQNFLKNSPPIIVVFGLPLFDPCFCWAYLFSYIESQEWKMISFWVATPFWVSIYHGHPVLPVTTQIPPELKGDQPGAPLFHGGTSYYVTFPATHGLGVKVLTSPCLSIHAALVSQTKTAHELHELPRKKAQSSELNHITPNEKSPEPAQGLNHTLSLAPKGFLSKEKHL